VFLFWCFFGSYANYGMQCHYAPTEQDIDFIIGGPPCQTFSAAGARASGVNGMDDRRGTLFQEYVRILNQVRPKAFLFENVYRIVGAQGGEPWLLIQEAFKGAGYKLHWRILDAADYGVPQHRVRLIIVGIRGDCEFPDIS
jgi:DNA (cytosine-5)-methyltransferase 1